MSTFSLSTPLSHFTLSACSCPKHVFPIAKIFCDLNVIKILYKLFVSRMEWSSSPSGFQIINLDRSSLSLYRVWSNIGWAVLVLALVYPHGLCLRELTHELSIHILYLNFTPLTWLCIVFFCSRIHTPTFPKSLDPTIFLTIYICLSMSNFLLFCPFICSLCYKRRVSCTFLP